jgi:hypothetical protein
MINLFFYIMVYGTFSLSKSRTNLFDFVFFLRTLPKSKQVWFWIRFVVSCFAGRRKRLNLFELALIIFLGELFRSAK